jgi:hypothetical protein
MNNKSTIKVIIYDSENKPKEIYIDMNDYSYSSRLLRKQIIKKSLREQEIWRQKQLDIFYRTGRPIFNMNTCNLRVYSHMTFLIGLINWITTRTYII